MILMNKKRLIIIFTLSITLGLIVGTQLINNNIRFQENGSQDSCNIRKENKNRYINEYVIPDHCSAPVAITIDNDGIIWFIENNNSKLVSFNQKNNVFNEYEISNYYSNIKSWSIITIDNEIWFTDHQNNLIWKFNKKNNLFEHYIIPTANAYPVQIINDMNGRILVSEIFGKKIAIIDRDFTLTNTSKGITEIEPPLDLEVLGGIAVDQDNTIWFTMLTWPIEGQLGNYKEGKFNFYKLPEGVLSPVGVAILDNNIWINDHGSNQFVVFNTHNKTYTKFITSPSKTDYTTTLPYWNKFDMNGNLWMNIHQSNTIAKFDTTRFVLIEYDIPTRNLDWGGIANALQFDIDNEGNIWFTEWTENKIGFLDVKKPLEFSIESSTREIEIESDDSGEVILTIEPEKMIEVDIEVSGTFTGNGLLKNISITFEQIDNKFNTKQEIPIKIEPQNLDSGSYTIMLSVRNQEITQSIPVKLIIK